MDAFFYRKLSLIRVFDSCIEKCRKNVNFKIMKMVGMMDISFNKKGLCL